MHKVESYPGILYKCSNCNKKNSCRFNLENPTLIAHRCKCGQLYNGEEPLGAIVEFFCEQCGEENTVKPSNTTNRKETVLLEDPSESWKEHEKTDVVFKQSVFQMKQQCKYCNAEILLLMPGS